MVSKVGLLLQKKTVFFCFKKKHFLLEDASNMEVYKT